MSELVQEFTSTGVKFFLHQENMKSLRNGRGMPVVSHIMLTDICQHSCAMCSVATREGNSLTMTQVREYLDQIIPLGLKAVILSGGGNPILYRCKETKADFNDAVDLIKSYGLEIGLISNGMPMVDWAEKDGKWSKAQPSDAHGVHLRKSWKTVQPDTLDKLTWVRVSMSGLDHSEREVFVPDIDRNKTTLGFSYIYHDIIHSPREQNHGKVSTMQDFRKHEGENAVPVAEWAHDRLPWLEDQIRHYVKRYEPSYCRLLCDCLRPDLIPERHATLSQMAIRIDPQRCFSQFKPPKAPKRCFLGYIHPVLNSDGLVFPCDSVCLANAALKGEHKFGSPWAVCKWNEIADYFSKPVKSMVDSERLCSGCVFHSSNDILASVVDGGESPIPQEAFTHPNFV